MTYIILLTGIALLILLITWAKLNAFIAFLIVSILIALASGMNVSAISNSLQKGIGDILGSLVVIIALGAMLGKLIADSGAAQKISSGLVKIFGKHYLQPALVLTAFITGIPLFYGVGFVLLVPLIISMAARYNIPAVYLGLPALAALSVTHGFLPPHPSPTALVQQFHADIGTTLLYGLIIAVPAIILAGPVFSLTLKKYTAKPLATFISPEVSAEELPGMFSSIMAALLPVILIAFSAIIKNVFPQQNIFTSIIHTIGDPIIAMLISLLVAIYTLGLKRNKKMKELMLVLGEAVKDVAMIILIIAGAGALKQVLTDSGLSDIIAHNLTGINVHPLLLAWSISAIIRICIGSATVAGLTTAGIVAPLIATTGVNPNLMVLATGAGSLMFSHVNDTGFWMFKEYFNLSLKDTLKTWSVMETIVSVVGLIGVFVINSFL